MHVLVTRPEPAASATAARLRAAGHAVTVAPLLATRALAWDAPEPRAIAFTSANGVGFAGAVQWSHIPVFAVGGATADAARAAGYGDVRDGGGTAAALFAAVAAAGFDRVLHLAGADRVDAAVPAGLTVDAVPVYAAEPVALTDEAAAALRSSAIDLILLYSPRSAALFAAAIDRLGTARATLAIAAISAATARAAGDGWRSVGVGAVPTEDALFAAACRLCNKRGDDHSESDDGAL